MHLILSIETSTHVCGAALLQEDQLVAEGIINRPRVHGEHLTSLLEETAQHGGCTFRDLDALAVSSGPGSYTGLRIGVSAAKGLAFACDLPVIAVPSLEVLAAQTLPCARRDDLIGVIRRARKNEVYFAMYRVIEAASRGAELRNIVSPRVAVAENLDELLERPSSGRLWLTGDTADAAIDFAPPSARLFTGGRPSPTAYWVGRSAIRRYEQNDFVDLAAFEPEYLRPFHTQKRKPVFDRLQDNT